MHQLKTSPVLKVMLIQICVGRTQLSYALGISNSEKNTTKFMGIHKIHTLHLIQYLHKAH
jgi:hypothetical protein